MVGLSNVTMVSTPTVNTTPVDLGLTGYEHIPTVSLLLPPVTWRVLKLGGIWYQKNYLDHAMAGEQLPCLGIACDRRVAHVHHRVLDISVPQPILHKRDIRTSVQQMHHNRVAQRMKPPLGLRNGGSLTILLH